MTVFWRKQADFYRTYDLDGNYINNDLFHGILRPGDTSVLQEVWIQNSASIRGTKEIFRNARIYLDIPDSLIPKYLETWPGQGGGVQISFDSGSNWITLSSTQGNPSDSSTWVGIPAAAIGSNAEAGVLNPNDVAVIWLRVKVPGQELEAGLYEFGLGIDVEVI